MPTCKVCKQPFTVSPEDKKILDSFDVPEPTLCFLHSLQRKLIWRNERHLYHRICELCKQPILAMYSPDSYMHVYCRDCWFSDRWNVMKYGRDYDENKSFLDQWFELIKQVPHFNLWKIGNNENSEFSNYILNSKDTYLSFSSVNCENSIYNKNVDDSKDLVDCFQVNNSELLYNCVNASRCYSSAFLNSCEKCSECYFCRDLFDCQNCFGCVNLKHKQYYWFNKPLSKEKYLEKISEALSSRKNFEIYEKQFEVHQKQYPVEFARNRNCENVTGNLLVHCSNVRNSFHMNHAENCGDCFRQIYAVKDCYCCAYGGWNERLYETVASGPDANNSMTSIIIPNSSNVAYCFSCYDSDDLFGCIGLQKKRYCILNKQYTKEEYFKLKEKIIKKMKSDGEWGEFFPIHFSPHAYNDAIVFEYFPLPKEDVLKMGCRWEDNQGGITGKETLLPENVPSVIPNDAAITKHILRCTQCANNYRIQSKELTLLNALKIPIPLLCQDCRFLERKKRDQPLKLWKRRCMCTKDHPEHEGHQCQISFETVYVPQSEKLVFCKTCYDKEVD